MENKNLLFTAFKNETTKGGKKVAPYYSAKYVGGRLFLNKEVITTRDNRSVTAFKAIFVKESGERLKAGTLWVNYSKNGKPYVKGVIDGVKCHGFINKSKDGTKIMLKVYSDEPTPEPAPTVQTELIIEDF